MPKLARARRYFLALLTAAAASAVGAAQAQPRASAPPSLGRRALLRHRPVVVIDPGHGGIDPGAIGESGVFEKSITLATALQLARLLVATARFRVVLTRRSDVYVPLSERVALAEALHADLFVSLHANALPNAAKRGLAVFTLSKTASDREAASVAASENNAAVDGLRLARHPREIEAVLVDLALRHTANFSLRLAHDLVSALGREVVLLDHPHRSAGFVVLTAPDIPSALVELGCLSNPIEEHLLQSPAYRRRLARGLAGAIETFFRDRAESADGPWSIETR
jgi:N-acetylmuramoyl-L-alanine amidase